MCNSHLKRSIDTHAFIWFVANDSKLSLKAISLIEDVDNELFVSLATLWEIAIKMSLGKLELKVTFEQLFDELQENNITLLEITFAHLAQLLTLPFHHRDPFDRLLIAQSMVEQFPLISVDTIMDNYQVQRWW